jgi:hypothetical protein
MPKATLSGPYHEAARDLGAEAEAAQAEPAEAPADEEVALEPEVSQEPSEPEGPEDYSAYPAKVLIAIGKERGLVVSGNAGYLPKAELVALLEEDDKK